MKTVQELIEKYTNRLEEIINPDNMTWEDFDLDGPVESYSDVNEYIESNSDYDEGQQTEKTCIRAFLEDLQELLHDEGSTRVRTVNLKSGQSYPKLHKLNVY